MAKPILAVDFDGVIHSYSKGWREGVIYDPAVPGFFDWAQRAKDRFRLVVYSSRSATPEGRAAMSAWMSIQWFQWAPATVTDDTLVPADFELAHEKPAAFLTIDDRAMQFRGDWSAWWLDPERLLSFRPWNVEGGGTTGVGSQPGLTRTVDQPKGLTPLDELKIIVDPCASEDAIHMHPTTYARLQEKLLRDQDRYPVFAA